MKQTQAKEFWIENRSNEYSDDQFWANETEQFDTDIHVVEVTPLIAAAPEMLEALERQLAWLEDMSRLTKSDTFHSEVNSEVENLKKIIKKAKGE